MGRYALHTLPDSSRALAFGLTWHTVFGDDPDAQARRLARSRGARYYTRGGSRTPVVGLLVPTRAGGRVSAHVPTYAAAACFARAYPRGPVAVSMLLSGDIWVALAVDGVVQSGGDLLHTDPADAQTQLDAWRARHPGLVVYGELVADEPLTADVLGRQLNDATRLLRAGWRPTNGPTALWAAVSLLGGAALWSWTQSWRTEPSVPPQADASPVRTIDVEQAWRRQLDHWADSTLRYNPAAFHALLATIASIPLDPGRWALTDIDCLPLAGHCRLRYLRTRLADSVALRRALPATWRIEWDGLQLASAWMPIERPATPLQQPLPPRDQTDLEWRSQLQQVHSAYAHIALSERQPVPLTPPTAHDADGTPTPLPWPAHGALVRPAQRTLQLNGPLRSLYLLPAHDGWQLTRLTIRRTEAAHPTLAASVLAAHVEGTLYEQ